jgi:hypothetical protein
MGKQASLTRLSGIFVAADSIIDGLTRKKKKEGKKRGANLYVCVLVNPIALLNLPRD